MLSPSPLLRPPSPSLWTLCRWDDHHRPGRSPSSKTEPDQTIFEYCMKLINSNYDWHAWRQKATRGEFAFQNSLLLRAFFCWPWFPEWTVGTLQGSLFRLGLGPFPWSKRGPMDGFFEPRVYLWMNIYQSSDLHYSMDKYCLQKWLNMQKLRTPRKCLQKSKKIKNVYIGDGKSLQQKLASHSRFLRMVFLHII